MDISYDQTAVNYSFFCKTLFEMNENKQCDGVVYCL